MNERFNMMNQEQMELGFGAGSGCGRARRNGRHSQRANWWFEQMRQVVDHAFDWEPAPRFQTDQILLPDTGNRR